MISATIWLDGKAYQGTHPTEDEPTPGPSNISFHDYNNARDKLLWADSNPSMIISPRNINSHLQRIMTRIADGTLTGNELIIRIKQ